MVGPDESSGSEEEEEEEEERSRIFRVGAAEEEEGRLAASEEEGCLEAGGEEAGGEEEEGESAPDDFIDDGDSTIRQPGSGESDSSDFEENSRPRKAPPAKKAAARSRPPLKSKAAGKEGRRGRDDEEMEEADEEGSGESQEFDKSVSKKVAAAKVKKEKKVHEEAENRPVPEGKVPGPDDATWEQDKDLKKKWTDEATDELPVLTQPADMFYDLVKTAEEQAKVNGAALEGCSLKALGEELAGRPIRVATMCSGTESPLLAMDLICKALAQQTGVTINIEHAFSCEIEPFKQAYIERNFAPPLLFRDIRELDGVEATTAYGSMRTVPGDCDILIAGTSCVDYSNLNNNQRASRKAVSRARPSMVCSAGSSATVRRLSSRRMSAAPTGG